MKKLVPIATLVVLAAFVSVAAINQPEEAPPSPKKIWVCHFAGHTAPTPFAGGGTTLDGDYVLNFVPGGPLQNQIDFCLNHGGDGIIEIAEVAAANGHGAQLLERAAGYP